MGDTEHKVYVGNLSYNVQEEDLKDHFAKYNVVEARVIYDRDSGDSRGFGFVTLGSAEDLRLACEDLNDTEFEGRKIRVSEAKSNGGGGGGGRYGGRGRGGGGGYSGRSYGGGGGGGRGGYRGGRGGGYGGGGGGYGSSYSGGGASYGGYGGSDSYSSGGGYQQGQADMGDT